MMQLSLLTGCLMYNNAAESQLQFLKATRKLGFKLSDKAVIVVSDNRFARQLQQE